MRTRSAGPLADPAELKVARRSTRKSADAARRKRQDPQQHPKTTAETPLLLEEEEQEEKEEEQVDTPSDEEPKSVDEPETTPVETPLPLEEEEEQGEKEEEQVDAPSDDEPKSVDEPETTPAETPLPLVEEQQEEQPQSLSLSQSQSQSPHTQANPKLTASNETVPRIVSEVEEPQSVPQSATPTTSEEPSASEVDPPLEANPVTVASEEPPVKSVDITKAEALKLVANAEPTSWLSASPGLVQHARAASEYLFNILALQTESPLDKLFTEGFDSEQIWQQIDLQATPTLAKIKKLIRHVEKATAEQLFPVNREESKRGGPAKQQAQTDGEIEVDFENEDDMSGSEDNDDEDVEENKGGESEEYSDYDEEEKKGVEDKFLKLTEMEKFLDRADAEDAGLDFEGSDEDDEDGEGDEEDLEVDEAFDFSAKKVDGTKEENAWGPKYSEFVGKPKKQKPKPSKHRTEVEEITEMDTLEEDEDGEDSEMETKDMDVDSNLKLVEETNLSAHEKQQGKVKKRIEQLEKANMDTKSWTMQGEVTASKRPKNSALEVELDFEHGARPAPVVTEEITQSIEEMIRLRIIESKYDDPQPRAVPSTATPKERVELDEEKSKKGLGEIYEQDYMESTGLAPAATPAIQTLKAEASVLFKNLCNKLDALSHFHFAPKPTIEEVGVKVDVPALAMEEVAPLAISDASMLAPEEVYKSAGIVKGEGELTPDERKRRRAAKKRKRKGTKKAAENDRRVRISSTPSKDPLKEMNVRHIPNKDKRGTSSFGKSAKVFAELDNAKERGNKAIKPDKPDKPSITPSFLKL